MTTEVTVTNDDKGQPEEAPAGDPIATLAAEALQASAETGAQVEIIESEIAEVSEVIEEVVEKTTDFSAQFLQVNEWMIKTDSILASLLESQQKMMESQEALSLALATPSTPPNLSEKGADGTPTIAPASDASPSDPVDNLPVKRAEEALEKVEQKATRWI